jgi:peptide deformylase
MIPRLLQDTHPMLAERMPHYEVNKTSTAIAATLVEAMTYHGGIGLAANQIGIRACVFAMETKGGPLVLFNPMVTWLSTEMIRIEEGCLSFPKLELKIKRPRECQIKYEDQEGRVHVANFAGIEARCALHEIDHLLGVVFTQKVSRLKLTMAKKKLTKSA